MDKKSKHVCSQQKATRGHIKAMVCCSAFGQCLKPMIISEKIWPNGLYSRNNVQKILYGKSPSNYMDQELFIN